MGNFSFSSLENTKAVASDRILRPYDIHKVKFVKAERTTVHSDKNNADYKVMLVRFEGDNGYYEEKYFIPTTSGRDVERKPNAWGGEQPSNADRAMMFVAHLVGILNPDGFEDLKKVVGKMNNFDQLFEAAVKLLSKVENKECYLKLCGRESNGVVYASLPFFTTISNGQAKINNNFLSLENDLGFNANEDKKRQEYENRKPTPVSENTTDTPQSNTSDIDDVVASELNDMVDLL